jgi:hypothetical protein
MSMLHNPYSSISHHSGMVDCIEDDDYLCGLKRVFVHYTCVQLKFITRFLISDMSVNVRGVGQVENP